MEPEAKWRLRWYRLCLARMRVEFPNVAHETTIRTAATVADRWVARRSPETFDVMRQEFFDECRRALREAQ